MLYIFLGYPKTLLNAGGLQRCVGRVEQLGILEHNPQVQYRKEGVFIPGLHEEQLYQVEHRLSQACLDVGITWDWFNENWAFGNGVTVHKTIAVPEYKIVVHGTNLSLEEFLAWRGRTPLAELELERMHVRHEGWEKYEARWVPGTCPQVPHIVHLTWLITQYPLPEFAYQRLRQVVEGEETTLLRRHLYRNKDFSAVRRWDGR